MGCRPAVNVPTVSLVSLGKCHIGGDSLDSCFRLGDKVGCFLRFFLVGWVWGVEVGGGGITVSVGWCGGYRGYREPGVAVGW